MPWSLALSAAGSLFSQPPRTSSTSATTSAARQSAPWGRRGWCGWGCGSVELAVDGHDVIDLHRLPVLHRRLELPLAYRVLGGLVEPLEKPFQHPGAGDVPLLVDDDLDDHHAVDLAFARRLRILDRHRGDELGPGYAPADPQRDS